MPKSSKRSIKELSKMLKVSGNAVCQTSLEICPDKFIGIKLRRISWEVKGLDSRIASKESFNKFGLVERASVPEKDNRAFEIATKVSEELPNLSGPNVLVGMKTRVESKSFSLGRDCDGGDGRNFGPASGDNEGWSFSFNRPGSLEIGNERESALIQKDQAGSKPIGLFLYAAKRDTSSSGWLPPDALWLSSAASDNSTPSCPSNSKGCRRNNVPENSCARSGRYVSRSKDPSCSQLPKALSLRCALRFSSAVGTKAGAAPYSVGTSAPNVLSCGRPVANVLRNLETRLFLRRPCGKCVLALKDVPPNAAVFPMLGVLPEVSSCPPRLPHLYRPVLVSIKL